MQSIKHTLILFFLLFSGRQLVASPIKLVAADTAAVKSALKKVNEAYGQAFARGDSSLLINSYAADACIMPANSSAIYGRAGFLAFYQFGYKAGVRNIVFKTIQLYGLTAEYVTEQGAYEMQSADGKSLGKGKYLVLWKHTADGWKMYRDMFNSDAPPPRMAK